jgi:hypothetical protein
MHSITPPAFKPAGLVYSVPRQSTLVFFFFCFPSSQVAHLVPACGLHKKRASLFFFCCCQLRHLSDTVKGVVFLNDITEAITESPGKVVFFFSRDSLALLVQFNAPSFSLVFYRLSLFTAA